MVLPCARPQDLHSYFSCAYLGVSCLSCHGLVCPLPYISRYRLTLIFETLTTHIHTQIDFLQLEHRVSCCGGWKDVKSHLPHNFTKSVSEKIRWAKPTGVPQVWLPEPIPMVFSTISGWLHGYLFISISNSISSENRILLLKKKAQNKYCN